MKKENEKEEINKTGIGKIIWLFLIIIFVAIIYQCGLLRFGGGTQKWKEEVQLSNGRVIVVEREMIREGGGGEIVSNPSGTKPKEYRIRFANQDGSGKVIEWRSIKGSDSWPEFPLILDVESGNPIIFSIVCINTYCKKSKKFTDFEIYKKYIYRNGAWIDEALPEKFEPHTTNLFLRAGIDMPKFVNLATKRSGNAEMGYPQSYRQVGPNRSKCD